VLVKKVRELARYQGRHRFLGSDHCGVPTCSEILFLPCLRTGPSCLFIPGTISCTFILLGKKKVCGHAVAFRHHEHHCIKYTKGHPTKDGFAHVNMSCTVWSSTPSFFFCQMHIRFQLQNHAHHFFKKEKKTESCSSAAAISECSILINSCFSSCPSSSAILQPIG